MLLYSNVGVELRLVSAPPTWSNCLKHWEREGSISTVAGVLSNPTGSNLGIRTWVLEEGSLRERWTRLLLGPPSGCHTQWRGVVRSGEVKGFSHSNVWTWSSGVEHGSWGGESGNRGLTDEEVSRSLLAMGMMSLKNHRLVGRTTIW